MRENVRIVIYGIGNCAEQFCNELKNRNEKIEIVCFIQTEKTVDIFRGKEVVTAKELNENDFDKLVIASDRYFDVIIEYLKNLENGYELYKKTVKYDRLFQLK